MLSAMVCEIERYALHDGPGIRSVVFLKGCPLTCLWCANPQTQKKDNELYYDRGKCVQCGRCMQACDWGTLNLADDGIRIDRNHCRLCGKCMRVCPAGALTLAGRWMNVEDVFAEVSRDMIFYQQSGGGVTISGGEVLMHEAFVSALLKKCKEHYFHTAIETSGFGSLQSLLAIVKYCDLILFDIKHADNEIHKKLTGVDNQVILENLRRLGESHGNIIIRVPLIPGLNDGEDNIERIMEIAGTNRIKEIHILPYHSLGREKYKQLGRTYGLETTGPPEKEQVATIKRKLERGGLYVNVGG
ncbi:hypothetical protein P22_1142 [Propionispora sp. 2/2-37]|uniref:glycyl-radical enzyme activating protein n=1 Tax=Propionispora sp. 2/2-37 TaxID=1677858 RepID=UPI0006BB7A59|nr:glycyl-radical enzyme activating protein [Propionispora sp. 2/2-37]CUH95073.1 hypothetical protein P22_1142 [Propionispora sp. 2/2-37]